MKYLSLFSALLLSLPVLAQETVYRDFEADSAAQPRGGMAYLTVFLSANLRKPIAVEAKGVGGRAVVTGIVEPDGRITNVKAIPGRVPELDREAVRVFSLFNAWQPALKSGKAVRQQVNIPVMFKANAPFPYADGALISYFDADKKPVNEGNDKVLYKQVSPVDTNGIPIGDIIVYKSRGTGWKEDYRTPFVRSKPMKRAGWDKPVYLVGYQDADKQWEGNVFGMTDGGELVERTHFDSGRSPGPDLTCYPSGLVAEQAETTTDKRVLTTWYPNGQIKQIWTVDKTTSPMSSNPMTVKAFWNSAGQQLVRNGNGQAVYTEMRKSKSDTTRQTQYTEQGLFTGGFKQGVWTGRYVDESYFYEETYDKGICQGGKSRIGAGDTVRYASQIEQPEFKGGMPGLGRFLSQSLRYPPDAQRARAEGKVFITFSVCTDGSLCDYEVLKGVHPELDREALRVVKAMSGRWKPGSERGQKVKVKYNLPINFNLQ